MVVTSPALPGERFTTEILAIDPILDPMTRTTRVRGLVSTPGCNASAREFRRRDDSCAARGAARRAGRRGPRHRRASAGLRREGRRDVRATCRRARARGGRLLRGALGSCVRESRSSRRRTSSSTRSRAFGPRSPRTNARPRRRAEVTRPMVERIIEFSAKNRGLVLLLTAVAVLGAVWTTKHIPLDAIPDLSDTQVIIYSRWDRSPDILEDQVTYPDRDGASRRAAHQGRPRVLRFRLLVRLRHLRGRHGSLLGAVACPRVPEQDPAATARGRADRDRAGCDQRRLGLPVCARGPLWRARRSRTCGAFRIGISATASSPCRCRRGRRGGRLRQAVSGERRPDPPARLQHSARTTRRRGPQGQQRGRGPARSSLPAPSTWCAAAATFGPLEDLENIVVGDG